MGVKIDVKFNVKKKFIVDGKEYDSLEELPEDVRKAFLARLAAKGTGFHSQPAPSAGQAEAAELDREQQAALAMTGQGEDAARGAGRIRRILALAGLIILLFLIYYFTHRTGAR